MPCDSAFRALRIARNPYQLPTLWARNPSPSRMSRFSAYLAVCAASALACGLAAGSTWESKAECQGDAIAAACADPKVGFKVLYSPSLLVQYVLPCASLVWLVLCSSGFHTHTRTHAHTLTTAHTHTHTQSLS